jgi:hypothetical protein
VPNTSENTTHGDNNARRASARRALGPRCVVFQMYEAPRGVPGRPRKARFKAEALLSNIAYLFVLELWPETKLHILDFGKMPTKHGFVKIFGGDTL